MIAWFKSKFSNQNQHANDQDLKKTGFDPTQVTTEVISQQPFCDFNTDLVDFINPSPQTVNQMLLNFKYFSNNQQHRHQLSYKSGGKKCGDPKQVNKVRGIGKEMILQIGRKLISGDLNLTRVSFPIKAMVPRTTLQTATFSSCTFPLFMGLACLEKDPAQKMKYLIAGVVSPNYYMNMFLKPVQLKLIQFNPILGQTFQASYSDGTQLYCQQISHHPPVSYFLIIGPKQSYRYYGYYDFQAKAGLNSGKLINRGKRYISFKSGQKFEISFLNVQYQGVFLGTLRQSTIGKLIVIQQTQKLYFKTKFGKVSGKSNDFFSGDILKNQKKIASVYGTYLGFVEIDGKRFWDGRYVKPFRLQTDDSPIPSDAKFRKDIEYLEKGRLVQAQAYRDQLENIQRKDAKLRKQKKQKKK